MEKIILLPRDQELKKVFRYIWSPCDPMFYRPNLYIHSYRVEWIALEISKFLMNYKDYFKINFDINLVKELARFHDDTEILTWDFLAMDKESFSDSQKNIYENSSQMAINILYYNYQNISEKFDYKEVLQILEKKEWLEFQIVDFADKLDAHLEISHELFAWNKAFAIKLLKWNIDLQPFEYTKNKLFKILDKISNNLTQKIDFKNTFLDLSWDFNTDFCLNNSRNHNIESLKIPTKYNLYDLWINLHFKKENKEFFDFLLNRLEW